MTCEIPIVRAQRGCVIVNMSSIAGFKGYPNTQAYNVSKHAIIGLTKSAALANVKHNIRVNWPSPLAVNTPQLRESFASQHVGVAEVGQSFFVTPRVMTTGEIARAVMFLADDGSTFITGINLDVTGGRMA